jgi:hypothetical protein
MKYDVESFHEISEEELRSIAPKEFERLDEILAEIGISLDKWVYAVLQENYTDIVKSYDGSKEELEMLLDEASKQLGEVEIRVMGISGMAVTPYVSYIEKDKLYWVLENYMIENPTINARFTTSLNHRYLVQDPYE